MIMDFYLFVQNEHVLIVGRRSVYILNQMNLHLYYHYGGPN